MRSSRAGLAENWLTISPNRACKIWGDPVAREQSGRSAGRARSRAAKEPVRIDNPGGRLLPMIPGHERPNGHLESRASPSARPIRDSITTCSSPRTRRRCMTSGWGGRISHCQSARDPRGSFQSRASPRLETSGRIQTHVQRIHRERPVYSRAMIASAIPDVDAALAGSRSARKSYVTLVPSPITAATAPSTASAAPSSPR